jgi:hypothetical protein
MWWVFDRAGDLPDRNFRSVTGKCTTEGVHHCKIKVKSTLIKMHTCC